MSNFYQPVTPEGAGETERPAPDKVLSGDPVFTTWNLEERDGLYCGIWRSTPGKWRISYDEWEYCRILSGRSVIASEEGGTWEVGPGDAIAFSFGTLHGAPANASSDRRRVVSVRWVGDGARFVSRPGTSSPAFPGLDYEDGEPFEGELFPLLYPRVRR